MSDTPHGQPASQHADTTVIDLPSLAASQAKSVIILTGDLLTTTFALLTSALSLVAALAWNNFMQAWLPTVHLLSRHDQVIKEFLYALTVTVIAVASVALISSARRRIRGRNFLTQ